MTETPPDAGAPSDEQDNQAEQAEARPLRMCDVCGLVDDHPRHVFGYGPEDDVQTPVDAADQAIANAQAVGGDALRNVVAHIRDNSTQMRHMDCCRAVGCPDGSCGVVTAGAEDARGMDLVAHLVRNVPTEG